MLFKFSLASSELVPMFAPPVFSKTFARTLFRQVTIGATRQWEDRSHCAILDMHFRQPIKPDGMHPSRPRPYVEIFTYFVFFAHSQQFLFDIYFYLRNNQITCSFCIRWIDSNLINQLTCFRRYPSSLHKNKRSIIQYCNYFISQMVFVLSF